jgi:site-specific recombinase XerD
MSAIYRNITTKPIPAGAVVRTKSGGTFAEWTSRGATRRAEIVGGRIRITSGTYWARWRDANGTEIRENTGCRDESNARKWLTDRLADVERERLGIVTPADRRVAGHLKTRISGHLDDFVAAMTAAGRAECHRKTTRRYVERVVEARSWACLADIDRSGMERWLAERERHGTSARSRNAHLIAVRSFLNWAIRADRLRVNPLDGIPLANERADRRRVRRAFTEAELVALFAAARERPLTEARVVRRGPRKGSPVIRLAPDRTERLARLGRERALSYRVLFFTGLRVGELRALRVRDLFLDGPTPFIRLPAAAEKSRRGADLPLRPDLAADIAVMFAERLRGDREAARERGTIRARLDPADRAFVAPVGFLRVLERDLAFAGIAKRDDLGRTVDLHAFRTSLCTHLARAGVPLRTAQAVMRHSDPSLTANIYTDPVLLDTAAAVVSLPSLTGTSRKFDVGLTSV